MNAAKLYLEKHPELSNMLGDKAEKYIAKHLQVVNGYFQTRSHKERKEFHSTSNYQVFYNLNDAANHAQSLPDKLVLSFEREDVAGLQEPEVIAGELITDEPLAGTGEGVQLGKTDADGNEIAPVINNMSNTPPAKTPDIKKKPAAPKKAAAKK